MSLNDARKDLRTYLYTAGNPSRRGATEETGGTGIGEKEVEKKNVEKMWIADQGDGTYRNPILYTDYSDEGQRKRPAELE